MHDENEKAKFGYRQTMPRTVQDLNTSENLSPISSGCGEDRLPFNILSLDGGGMRGLYTATVLRTLSDRFAEPKMRDTLDIGKGFDLVVGTSTGAILAAAIAAGIPLNDITRLYEEAGPRIFRNSIPPYDKSLRLWDKARFCCWVVQHLWRPGNRNETLVSELRDIFGSLTLGELYRKRGIGLCITATAFLQHTPRVFKTPHLEQKQRDNELLVADACLASSAAPIYLPLVSITADGLPGQIYADGGLWANNPVLLGVIEGLALSAPEQPIVVMSVGTCPAPTGSSLPAKLNRGIMDWRGGVLPLDLALNAQGRGAHYATTLLAEQLGRLGKRVRILRCKESKPSADQVRLLQLDSASKPALDVMKQLGNEDGHSTYRWCQLPDDPRGEILTQIFERMPQTDNSHLNGKDGK